MHRYDGCEDAAGRPDVVVWSRPLLLLWAFLLLSTLLAMAAALSPPPRPFPFLSRVPRSPPQKSALVTHAILAFQTLSPLCLTLLSRGDTGLSALVIGYYQSSGVILIVVVSLCHV